MAVLIHGGFWKAEYGLELMDALAADLVARGWAAWNIEYRRLGNGGGVPYTLDDVGAAIDHLDQLPGVDLSRVVTIGHSAGGHLAAWAATRDHQRVAVTGVVSQAGVLDLQRAAELRLSNGVVDRFLKGQPTRRRLADRAAPARRPRAAHPRRARRHRAGRDQRALRAGERRSPDRRARGGPLRPPRPHQPAVEGGDGMALTRDDAARARRARPARGLPRPLRHRRRAPALPRRQLARAPAEGHARAAAPRDRPVGRRAGRAAGRSGSRRRPAPATRWPRCSARARARCSSPTAPRSTSTSSSTRCWTTIPRCGRWSTDADNFPTDRYVLEGIARARGLELDDLRERATR